jgi:DNA helicase-2/ATP-dependent DNA helicase PcrA
LPDGYLADKHYTQNQLDAITTIDHNLQIIACAGSGKTQVVAERVAHTLAAKREEGVVPANVVAFTFTDKAAVELKDRIAECVRARLGEVTGMAEMYVGTIHGYCLNLLQSHLPEYFKYEVLTDIQARIFVDRFSAKSGLSSMVASTGTQMRRYLHSNLYMSVLSTLREAEIDDTQLSPEDAARLEMCRNALEQYQDLLDEHRYLDYTEIMVRAVASLYEHEDLAKEIAARVKYLIVDEYQDVNPLQEALVRRLHSLGANLCVVGDDDQTIYQWRGSDVRNILTFAERYPDVVQIPIEDNFRSSEAVIDAAVKVIEHNDPHRLEKRMLCADAQTHSNGDLLALSFDDPGQQAEWVAEKVAELVGVPFKDRPEDEARGLSYSDFAVLCRSVKNDGPAIVEALRVRDIPVVVVGMAGLFDTLEAQAAVTVFRYMARDADEGEVRDAWLAAGLGIDSRKLDEAIAQLDSERQWDTTQRFSVYNLQRTFLRFLERIELREENVPGDRGELVYYNLGKFSQVISDYEQIHFKSDPQRKYEGFSEFLVHQAPTYYPEGWQDAALVRPDAVQVMTVHQAKGMQWPVVFVPALQKNRFPSVGGRGLQAHHFLPEAAIPGYARYRGSVEDERRLFYVALTRSKKWLFCSWAPREDNQLYRKPSQFLSEFAASQYVLTRDPRTPLPERLDPTPRSQVANIALSFSELKYLFECPYQFKLRFVYGFNPPLAEPLGYGKSLHDALAELHQRALAGEILDEHSATELVDRHLNVPFAYEALREQLRQSGIRAVARYIKRNHDMLDKIEHVEQVVEINMGDGILVNGRIDLIRRTDRREVIVVDFKSTERAQAEDITRTQLHVYALGYRDLTGASADLIEIHNLDDSSPPSRELVDHALEEATRVAVLDAGVKLRANRLTRLEPGAPICFECDHRGVCRTLN